MFSKAAQVFLASTLLSHAAALVLKPTDPSNLVDVKINAGEKRSAPDTIQLKPIHDPADLIAGHPRRRAAEGDQVFDPSNIHSFYWAEELTDDVYVANFTMEAPADNERLVPIENFADRLKSIKCTGDNIIIEFSSESCFDYASGVWNWVNQNDNNTMTLVTKAGQCDPDEDRDPFSVRGIEFEKTGLKAILSAKRLTWQEAAHDFTLTTSQHPSARKLEQKRATNPFKDVFNDSKKQAEEAARKAKEKAEEEARKAKEEAEKKAKEAERTANELKEKAKQEAEEQKKKLEDEAKKIKDEADKALEEAKKKYEEAKKALFDGYKSSIPLNIDFRYNQTLFDYGKEKYGMALRAGAQIETGGQLIVDVDFKVKEGTTGSEVERAKVSIHPKGLKASVILSLDANGKLGKNPINFKLPGVKMAVSGINIPRVITLGPVVEGSVFLGSSQLEGEATASIGGKATFSDSAVLTVDAKNKEGNSAKGWDPKFEKTAQQLSASIEGGVKAGIALSIGIEASVLDGRFGVEAKIEAKAPYFEAIMKAEKNTAGVCNGKKTSGVSFGAKAGVDISLDVGMTKKAPIFSQLIFEKSVNLPWKTCFAFGSENANTSGNSNTVIGRKSKSKSKGKPSATRKPEVTNPGKIQGSGSMKKPTTSKTEATETLSSKPTTGINASESKNSASGTKNSSISPSPTSFKPSVSATASKTAFSAQGPLSRNGTITMNGAEPTTLLTAIAPAASPTLADTEGGDEQDIE